MCTFLKRIYTAGTCQSSSDLKFTKMSLEASSVLFGKWKKGNWKIMDYASGFGRGWRENSGGTKCTYNKNIKRKNHAWKFD